MDALAGLHACSPDLANGGLDQFVWNHGAAHVRAIASVWCEVGAVENGELLLRLAAALEAQEPFAPEAVVDAFHRFRREVGGPEFGGLPIEEELEEALLEWALEHPERFA